MKTHEELSVDQILRLQAMQMAMGYITQNVESEFDLGPLATQIYEFVKGETK